MAVKWHGDELLERLQRDAANAINAVTKAAAEDARTSHPWRNRTGNLETRIKSRKARPVGSKVTGAFGFAYARGRAGVRDGFYGLFHEEPTTHEFIRPTLRPAADRHFPALAAEIRKRFQKRAPLIAEREDILAEMRARARREEARQ